MAAVETLLQYGADPRLYADDGNTPEQVGAICSISLCLTVTSFLFGFWSLILSHLLLSE